MYTSANKHIRITIKDIKNKFSVKNYTIKLINLLLFILF